jgi:hypothetical protein
MPYGHPALAVLIVLHRATFDIPGLEACMGNKWLMNWAGHIYKFILKYAKPYKIRALAAVSRPG